MCSPDRQRGAGIARVQRGVRFGQFERAGGSGQPPAIKDHVEGSEAGNPSTATRVACNIDALSTSDANRSENPSQGFDR